MTKELSTLELVKEIERLKAAKSEAYAIVNQCDHDIKHKETELALRGKIYQPRLSDHALVRYLERVHGFDFAPYREEILTDNVKHALMLGATNYKINGVNFVCKDGVLVTVLPS